jgi:FkbM family methyltransferase
MYKSVDGRWGKSTFFAKDEYVGKSLYHYGEYNPDETEMIISLAYKNRLCLDVGANIGVISQALETSGYKVIAFEPQPEVYKVLQMNFGGEAHNVAVGSAEGTAEMPKLHYSEKGNFGGISLNTKSPYGSYKVVVVTLDDMIASSEDVGFIKIDVEGYELEVLKGAVDTIRRCRPVLYIEDDRVSKSVSLRKYITELGYTIEEHKPTLYREENFFDKKTNVWDKLYASHNLICRPC